MKTQNIVLVVMMVVKATLMQWGKYIRLGHKKFHNSKVHIGIHYFVHFVLSKVVIFRSSVEKLF